MVQRRGFSRALFRHGHSTTPAAPAARSITGAATTAIVVTAPTARAAAATPSTASTYAAAASATVLGGALGAMAPSYNASALCTHDRRRSHRRSKSPLVAASAAAGSA